MGSNTDKPHRASQVYLTLKDQIRKQIRNSDTANGSRFSSIRELAKQYNVSTVTANKAIAALQVEGLIKARQGSGLYITAKPSLSTSAHIGLLMSPSMVSGDHPFLAGMYRGIMQELAQYGLEAAIYASELSETQSVLHKLVESGLISGVILSGAAVSMPLYSWLLDRQAAVVIIGRAEDPDVWAVDFRPEPSFHDQLDFLVGLGHKRIGSYLPVHLNAEDPKLTPQDGSRTPYWVVQQRIWKEYAEQGLIDPDPSLLPTIDVSDDNVVDKLMEWYHGLNPRPTALDLPEERIAYRMLLRLRSEGVRVPEDVSLIARGSEQSPEDMSLWVVPTEKVGAAASRLIKRQLDGDMDGSRQVKIYPMLRRGRTVRVNSDSSIHALRPATDSPTQSLRPTPDKGRPGRKAQVSSVQ